MLGINLNPRKMFQIYANNDKGMPDIINQNNLHEKHLKSERIKQNTLNSSCWLREHPTHHAVGFDSPPRY